MRCERTAPLVASVGYYMQVREASVLFIDNPVGAGFSYINVSEANYTTNIHQITDDLISFIGQFVQLFPSFSVR